MENNLNCGFWFCVWCFAFGFGFALKEESDHHFVNKWRFMLYIQGIQVKIRKRLLKDRNLTILILYYCYRDTI